MRLDWRSGQIFSLSNIHISRYIPWNIHEPQKGKYIFDGQADLVRFMNHASELGLLVLLRPGPFIAAEFEFGGFPIWLTTMSDTMR